MNGLGPEEFGSPHAVGGYQVGVAVLLEDFTDGLRRDVHLWWAIEVDFIDADDVHVFCAEQLLGKQVAKINESLAIARGRGAWDGSVFLRGDRSVVQEDLRGDNFQKLNRLGQL